MGLQAHIATYTLTHEAGRHYTHVDSGLVENTEGGVLPGAAGEVGAQRQRECRQCLHMYLWICSDPVCRGTALCSHSELESGPGQSTHSWARRRSLYSWEGRTATVVCRVPLRELGEAGAQRYCQPGQ